MAQIILDSNNNLIQGDFDNATLNNRTKLQTTTTNATTNVYVVPNGSSTSAGVSVANNSSLTNASKIVMATNGTTDTQIISGINGSGTYLPLSFYTNNALAMQITTGGIISAAGGGIQFPATQIPSADANTLDDYEEGTFTPNYGTSGTAPSLTYAARNGYYVRIGKMVYVSLNVEAATVSSSGTGNLNITGLPFTVSNLNSSSNSPLAIGYAASWASSQNPMNAMVFQGTTYIRPYYMSTLGGNKLDITSSGLANNASIWLAGCYYTDS
jgi:hypothetical protein